MRLIGGVVLTVHHITLTLERMFAVVCYPFSLAAMWISVGLQILGVIREAFRDDGFKLQGGFHVWLIAVREGGERFERQGKVFISGLLL